MKITVHRGASQIGGCITEIASRGGTRILIDLGHNLPDVSNEPDKYDDHKNLEELLEGISAVVYSQSRCYLELQPKLQEFVDSLGCAVEYVHTSGHARPETIEKVCNIINPLSAIIPIHKDAESDFHSLDLPEELKAKIITPEAIQKGIEL